MTKGLILHPIAAIISFVAVVLSFLSSPWYRLALGLIAHLMTITAWALTFSFVVACQKYSGINIPAKYGLAFWFTQVALVTSSAAAMLNYYTRKYKAEAKAEAEAAKK